MPWVRIHDLPNHVRSSAALIHLARTVIPQRLAQIPELGIDASEVRVTAEGDLIEDGTGQEVSADLYMKATPERTEAVCLRAADVVAKAIDEFAITAQLGCKIVEVVPHLFNADTKAIIVHS